MKYYITEEQLNLLKTIRSTLHTNNGLMSSASTESPERLFYMAGYITSRSETATYEFSGVLNDIKRQENVQDN